MSSGAPTDSTPRAGPQPTYEEFLALYQTAEESGAPNGNPQAKTFEEFKAHYALVRKRNMPQPDSATAAQPTPAAPGAVPNAGPVAPPPMADGPELAAPRGRFPQNLNPVAMAQNVFRHVPEIPLWRILIGAFLIFGGFGFTGCVTVLVVYCVAEQVRRWAGTLHVRRVHADAPRTLVGSLFATAEPHRERSTTVKVAYMILKCVEAFVVSFYPNYSVDRLEVELQTDGIVR